VIALCTITTYSCIRKCLIKTVDFYFSNAAELIHFESSRLSWFFENIWKIKNCSKLLFFNCLQIGSFCLFTQKFLLRKRIFQLLGHCRGQTRLLWGRKCQISSVSENVQKIKISKLLFFKYFKIDSFLIKYLEFIALISNLK